MFSVAAAAPGVFGEGQGEAWGTGHLGFTSPRGLSLRVNKECPGAAEVPQEAQLPSLMGVREPPSSLSCSPSSMGGRPLPRRVSSGRCSPL